MICPAGEEAVLSQKARRHRMMEDFQNTISRKEIMVIITNNAVSTNEKRILY
jgi:hypothetical protein